MVVTSLTVCIQWERETPQQNYTILHSTGCISILYCIHQNTDYVDDHKILMWFLVNSYMTFAQQHSCPCFNIKQYIFIQRNVTFTFGKEPLLHSVQNTDLLKMLCTIFRCIKRELQLPQCGRVKQTTYVKCYLHEAVAWII